MLTFKAMYFRTITEPPLLSVASYYLPYLLENVGITDTNTKLLLNIVYAITGWIPAIAGARFHDIIGRRKMLLGATAGMILALAVAAGTAAGYVHTGSKTDSNASIAFIYIFGSVFAFAWTSMQPIYPGEVLSNDMRAKGMTQLSRVLIGFTNYVLLNAFRDGCVANNQRLCLICQHLCCSSSSQQGTPSIPRRLVSLLMCFIDRILVLCVLCSLGRPRVLCHLSFLR